jgi:hypothetical protein
MPTPSILLIPDRYKAAVLYSQIPDSGAVDFDVTRATTAYRTNASGVLESVASGVPRLDYPIGGGCPSLLVEPAATNLVLYSEEFDDAYWTKTNATITANSTVAPDGTTTADTVTTSGGLVGNISRAVTVADDSVVRVVSLNIKKESTSSFGILTILYSGGTGRNTGIQFNKQTGVSQYVGNGFGGGFTAPSSFGVIDLGEYWRFFVSLDNNSTGNTTATFRVQPNRGTSFGNITAVDGTAVIWGAQLETGSVATSYIPTVAATATRNADVISKTGVSGFIGQTEGTLYAEVDVRNLSDPARILEIGTGAATNRILIRLNSSLINSLGTVGGAQQWSLNTSTISSGIYKIALGYAQNNVALYINGALIASSASANIPSSMDNIYLGYSPYVSGGNYFNNRIRAAAIYPTRLTNSQLSALTTL